LVNSGWLAFMAMMAGMGAIPAVALSKVAAVMPEARASVLACVRKASNLRAPKLGSGGGWTGIVTMGGWGAGIGLGAVGAQAIATSNPSRTVRRGKLVMERWRRSIPARVYRFSEIFGGKPPFFAAPRGLTGVGALHSFRASTDDGLCGRHIV
jgi:hypothetical protein